MDRFGIPTWLLLVGGGALWLVLGAVFGSHGKVVRDTVRDACHAVADALRNGAQAVLGWARWCFTNIENVVKWLGDRLPKWEENTSTNAAVPAAAPAPSASDDVSSTMVVLAGIGLIAFVAVNGYLLYEITPDLFAFSPEDLRSGSARFIAWLVPIAILFGEVIGGLILKSEQRRKRAGNTEASTTVPWVIFLFCYGVELAAGVRRAASFLWAASPFADEVTHITWDSAATAALWLVLAGGVPWAIFLISRYVEPALNQSDAARQILRFVGQVVRFAATVTAIAVVGLIASIALGLGGIVTGFVGVIAHVLGGAVRYLVYGILFVLVIALIDASGMTMTWLRSWRRSAPPSAPTAVALVLVIASAFLNVGCQKTTARTTRTDRQFATVSVSDLKPAPKPEVFDRVAEVNLPRYIGEQHKVVRVLEPMLHVCLADVTASVDLELRRALLRKCAEFVSDLSNGQGPETTGVVVPIVDAALTSKLPVERLDGAVVPTRCATNPPIPEIPSRSTIADMKMKGIRDAFTREERNCTEAVGREYAMATRTRNEQRTEFVSRVLRELGGRVYPRTDIIGALRYVAELVRTERKQFGHGLAVRVTIISDLEDDANGCRLRDSIVSCPDAPMRDVRKLLTD
ncbi:MAG: MMPL family transporter, partial [bacterium]|nr:MMPL family transporter [bacterium]